MQLVVQVIMVIVCIIVTFIVLYYCCKKFRYVYTVQILFSVSSYFENTKNIMKN